jgi:hypothetical protein
MSEQIETAARAEAERRAYQAFPAPFRHNATRALMDGLKESRKREGYVRDWLDQAAQPRTVSAEQYDALRAGVQRVVDGWPLAPSTTIRVLRALLAEAGEVR